MNNRRQEYINNIRTVRMQLADTQKRNAQQHHFVTGDDFYLEEMIYWQDVKNLDARR